MYRLLFYALKSHVYMFVPLCHRISVAVVNNEEKNRKISIFPKNFFFNRNLMDSDIDIEDPFWVLGQDHLVFCSKFSKVGTNSMRSFKYQHIERFFMKFAISPFYENKNSFWPAMILPAQTSVRLRENLVSSTKHLLLLISSMNLLMSEPMFTE